MASSAIKNKNIVSATILFVLLIGTVVGFNNEISYVGVAIKNQSAALYNGTFTVTTYLFTSSSCTGQYQYAESSSIVITDGNFRELFNYTQSNKNQTFYLKPSIGGVNETCFKYTASAQAQKSTNATQSDFLRGYTPNTLPIAGDVTGTLASTSVDSLTLNTITYTSTLGVNNITEDVLISGGTLTTSKWCVYDGTGIDCNVEPVSDTTIADTSVNTTKINFNSSGDWHTLTLEQLGVSNITASFFVDDASGGADGNTNVTSIGLTSDGGTVTLNLAQPSLSNLTTSFTDKDTNLSGCTDCVTDAMTSNTLTCSVLVAATSVVSNAEVDDDLTVAGGLIQLNNNTFSGTLGVGNLTACSEGELLKFVGGVWGCQNDNTTASSNTNTNVTKIQFNGSDDTFTLQLEQPGLSNLTATFTVQDDGGSGGNSTDQMRNAVNASGLVYNFSVACHNFIGGDDADFCSDADTTIGDTLWNINATVFRNESGTLGIVMGLWANRFYAISNPLGFFSSKTNFSDNVGFVGLNTTVLLNESGNIGINRTFFDATYLDNTDTNTAENLTADILIALINAQSPNGSNYYATINDLTSGNVTVTQVVNVKNTESSAMTESNPAYFSGYSGGRIEVKFANNSLSSRSADCLVIGTIGASQNGQCVVTGEIPSLDTSAYSVGDNLYLAELGNLTNTKPLNAACIQKIGQVLESSAVNGIIYVSGANRCNDVSSSINITGNIIANQIIASDWTNVTITESQITDLSHPNPDTNVTKIGFNATGDIFTLSLEQTNLNNLTATFTVDDTDTVLSDEQVQDKVGAMWKGTEDGVNVTYDDTNEEFDISVEIWRENYDFDKNVTVEALHLENDVANHHISDNSTCVIIKGDTSTLNIC